MAADIDDVMTAVGTALGTVSGLRVYSFPPLSAQVPFAFPDMPETIAYDLSMGRGSDRFTLMVHVAVSKVVDRSAWQQMSAYASSSDPKSIKNALELGSKGWRVTEARFGTLTLAGTEYSGITFSLDVAA